MSSPVDNKSNETSSNICLTATNLDGSLGANSVNVLSKTEKIEQICKICEQLIKLETSYTNPLTPHKEEKWTHFHHRNGTVVTEIETTTTYTYDDTADKQIEQLHAQLEELDVGNFMLTLTDDLGSLTRIMNLFMQVGNSTLNRDY